MLLMVEKGSDVEYAMLFINTQKLIINTQKITMKIKNHHILCIRA